MPLGPVMLDLRGAELEADEREMLLHPLVGGVILFSRNYRDPGTLIALTSHIHALREPALIIAVDHEGGRVQRFLDGFTRLPPARCFGELYDKDEGRALSLVENVGWLLASELLSVGVDLSFTPVLDLDAGISAFMGERTYHHCPDVVAELGRYLMKGMGAAGMMAVGKHFPGHGHVREDSHEETPVDKRRYEDILAADLAPFERLINAGLAAIMPAHVIYEQVDDKPAGFSRIWLDDILRNRLGFQGVIFSDDLNMAGAGVAGSYTARAYAALDAGCDMVLVCNNQPAAISILQRLQWEMQPGSQERLMDVRGREPERSYEDLLTDARCRKIRGMIHELA